MFGIITLVTCTLQPIASTTKMQTQPRMSFHLSPLLWTQQLNHQRLLMVVYSHQIKYLRFIHHSPGIRYATDILLIVMNFHFLVGRSVV